jgi:hypothetical protein
MIDKDMESCVTSVTYPTLLERMCQKRLGGSDVIDEKLVSLPLASQNIQDKEVKSQLPPLVIDWLSICLGEGHMQPSQPSVGRLEGWPIRSYFKNSLYVDFDCWCLKAGIPPYLIPSKTLFYQGTNAIFDTVDDNRYQFPDLMICREKFSQLLKEGQYDESKTDNR